MAQFNKEQARQTILTIVKDIILNNFDRSGRRDDTKEIKEDNYNVYIKKKCNFPNVKIKIPNFFAELLLENYIVEFKGTLQGKIVEWAFYLDRINITDYSIIEFIDPKGTSQNKLTIRSIKH